MRQAWLGLVAAVICGAGAGCFTLSSLGNATTHTVTWKKDGFEVEDIRRKFTYDANGPKETAELEGRVTFVDLGADGTVDEVKNDSGEWTRGEPGTGAIFEEADADFRDMRAYLRIDGYRADWDAMTPDERARAGGLGTRP